MPLPNQDLPNTNWMLYQLELLSHLSSSVCPTNFPIFYSTTFNRNYAVTGSTLGPTCWLAVKRDLNDHTVYFELSSRSKTVYCHRIHVVVYQKTHPANMFPVKYVSRKEITKLINIFQLWLVAFMFPTW